VNPPFLPCWLIPAEVISDVSNLNEVLVRRLIIVNSHVHVVHVWKTHHLSHHYLLHRCLCQLLCTPGLAHDHVTRTA
jgi:hypothetical protein